MSVQPVLAGTHIDAENPWPGLSAFDEGAQQFFKGRDAESVELLRCVGQAPLTVLFGKSGLGKTSLLRAGLFPRLRQQHVLPVYVRLNVRDTSAPLIEQVSVALRAEMAAHGVDARAPEPGEPLWEYLHDRQLTWWSRRNQSLTLLFVFDQFEEVFTLGAESAQAIKRLQLDLADLIENRIPTALADRIEAGVAPQHLDLRGQRYKLLLSFREDFLPEVESWKGELPSLLRNRLRLLPMGAEHALEVVSGTTYAGHSHHLVSGETARAIVHFVASVQIGDEMAGRASSVRNTSNPAWERLEIEPALLSLVCQGLNEKRKAHAQSAIEASLLKETGAAIISDFYRLCVADVPEKTRRFIEDALITEGGFRNSYPMQDALDQGLLSELLLRQLVDRRLLRIEHQLGADRVELIHDRITSAVREHRDREREHRRTQRQRRLWWAGGVAAAGGLVVSVVLFVLWQNAQTALRMAVAGKLVMQSRAALDGHRAMPADVALLLGAAAFRLAPNAETYGGLHYALGSTASQTKVVVLPDPVHHIGPDGRTVVTESGQQLRLWDLSNGKPLAGPKNWRVVERFLPDAKTLIFSAENGVLRLWSLVNATDLGALGNGNARSVLRGEAVDDRRFAYEEDGAVHVWDLVQARASAALVGLQPDLMAALAISPDGKLAAAADGNAALQLWNLATGQSVGVPMNAHSQSVDALDFSADGKTLISGGKTDTTAIVEFWEVATQQARPPPISLPVGRVDDILPFDSKTSLVISRGGLSLWDVASGALRGGAELSDLAGVFALSADRRTFAYSTSAQTLRWVDTATGKDLREPLKLNEGLRRLAFNRDATALTAAAGGTLRTWTLGGPQRLHLFANDKGSGSTSFVFSPDGRTLATGGFRFLRISDWISGADRASDASAHRGAVSEIAFSPDGRSVVSSDVQPFIGADADLTLRSWDATSGQPRWTVSIGREDLTGLVFSPDGKTIVSRRGRLQFWEAASGKRLGPDTSSDPEWVTHVAFGRDGQTLVSLGRDGLRTWDLAAGKVTGPSVPLAGWQALEHRQIELSPDGQALIALGKEGIVRFWDAPTGLVRAPSTSPIDKETRCIAFSPDGKLLASGNQDGSVRLWDIATVQARDFAPNDTGSPVTRIVFSPDGRSLLSIHEDASPRLWDTSTGQRRGSPLEGHQRPNEIDAVFSPDSRMLVTGAGKDPVRFWDAGTAQQLGSPSEAFLDKLSFSPDGSTIIGRGNSGLRTELWDAPTVWIDRLCSKLVRNLSRAEWALHVGATRYVTQCPGLPVPVD